MPNTPITTTSLNKIPKELFLVAGGFSDIPVTEWDPLADTYIAKRIPETQKHLIARNNTWQANKIYNSYVSSSNYTTVFNSDNNIVYLCLHNNLNFRNDSEDVLVKYSTEAPSHALGRKTYDDGYTWLPLWKVDFTEYEFINSTDIPIPNLTPETGYSTFTEKYESLCGSGTTAFGCCCLYFRENSEDEITGEVYNKGDVTNETIFSDCYECQKLADALNKDVIFLSGYTAGSITSSNTGENPLCPATKTIKSLQETLEADVYNIVPGSSRDYQLQLLKNHSTNNSGIMSVSIDLSGLSETQKTLTSSGPNPTVTINDPHGSGAVVRLKTTPVGLNEHLVYGIELVSEGSGYGLLPSWTGTGITTTILDKITVHVYPEDIYNNPELFTPPIKYRVVTNLKTSDMNGIVAPGTSLQKIAIMADPYGYSSEAPAVYVKNDASTIDMTTTVIIYRGPIASGAPQGDPGFISNTDYNYLDIFTTPHSQNSNNYDANIIGAIADGNGYVYLNDTSTAEGYILKSNDDAEAYTVNDIVTVNGLTYSVYSVTPPPLDARTANFFNVTDISNDPIGVTSAVLQTTLKSYQFDIQVNLT